MTRWIQSLIEMYSYGGIALLMFIENVFPPIPSELIMPLAGFFTTQGRLTLGGVIVAGTVGSLLGALPLYYAGKCAGYRRLHAWCNRHGRWIGLTGRDLDHANAWFERHGGKTVLLCRLIPGVRSLISVPAGIMKMPLPQFLLYTTIGSAAWSAALAYAGRSLGRNYEAVERFVGPISTGVVAIIVITIVIRAVRLTRAETTAG